MSHLFVKTNKLFEKYTIVSGTAWRSKHKQLDITLQTQHVDVGLQMITAIRLLIYWWY